MKVLEESGPTEGEERFSFWIRDQYGGVLQRLLRSLAEA